MFVKQFVFYTFSVQYFVINRDSLSLRSAYFMIFNFTSILHPLFFLYSALKFCSKKIKESEAGNVLQLLLWANGFILNDFPASFFSVYSFSLRAGSSQRYEWQSDEPSRFFEHAKPDLSRKMKTKADAFAA